MNMKQILIALLLVVSFNGHAQTIDGKPYSQLQVFTTDVNTELANLKFRVASLESGAITLTQTITQRDAEIVALKKRIAELEGVVTPPPVEPPPATGELYFADDFEGSTTGNLLGGWTDWKTKLPFVEGIYFNNSGSAPYVIQEIRKDEANRNVMYAKIVDDSPSGGTTRAQMTVDLKQELPIVHTSHRIKLHPDIAHLTNYSGSIRWFTLFEMWNLRDNTQGGDPAGSSRISLSLFKDSGAGQPLFWHVAYEEMQPGESVKWQQKGMAKIPFNKWFTLDVLVKRGSGTNGKVKVVIQEDGGQPVTVFDINNNTIYRDKPNLYINQWQIFKLYSSDQIMDWMRNAGKEISVQLNDVKWYKQ